MRVNYPLKYSLVRMDNDGVIDMENDVHKFCVSFITGEVAKVGLDRVVGAWNQHRIPGIFLLGYQLLPALKEFDLQKIRFFT